MIPFFSHKAVNFNVLSFWKMNAIIEFFTSFPFKPIPYDPKETFDQAFLRITFWAVLIILILAVGAMVLIIGICCCRMVSKFFRWWEPSRLGFHSAELVELDSILMSPSINHPSYIRYETVDDIPVHFPARGERRRPSLFLTKDKATEMTVFHRLKSENYEIVETEEMPNNVQPYPETAIDRHFQMIEPGTARPHRPVSL